MILKIYAYYNKLIEAFDTKFQLDDHEDSKVVYNVQRGLKARLALGTYQDLKFLAFYKLGTFDDETGEFVADKTLLVDFDNVIAQFEAKNIKKENTNEQPIGTSN